MKNRALYKTRLSAVEVIPVSGAQMLFTTTSVPQRMIRSDGVILSLYICCFSDSEQRENNQVNVIKHARISKSVEYEPARMIAIRFLNSQIIMDLVLFRRRTQ
jgi:arginine exporter protein ArgO